MIDFDLKIIPNLSFFDWATKWVDRLKRMLEGCTKQVRGVDQSEHETTVIDASAVRRASALRILMCISWCVRGCACGSVYSLKLTREDSYSSPQNHD